MFAVPTAVEVWDNQHMSPVLQDVTRPGSGVVGGKVPEGGVQEWIATGSEASTKMFVGMEVNQTALVPGAVEGDPLADTIVPAIPVTSQVLHLSFYPV